MMLRPWKLVATDGMLDCIRGKSFRRRRRIQDATTERVHTGAQLGDRYLHILINATSDDR